MYCGKYLNKKILDVLFLAHRYACLFNRLRAVSEEVIVLHPPSLGPGLVLLAASHLGLVLSFDHILPTFPGGNSEKSEDSDKSKDSDE